MSNPLKKLFSGAAGLRRGLLLYGPFLGAGVRVEELSADFRRVRVSMGMHWYNRNYVGTHFGGSLYSMTDPFYMLMLMNNLGRDYVVWDKSASIDFVRPGKGRVFAEFELTEAMLDEVKAATAGKLVIIHSKLILLYTGKFGNICFTASTGIGMICRTCISVDNDTFR